MSFRLPFSYRDGMSFWDYVDSMHAPMGGYYCACENAAVSRNHGDDCAKYGPGWRDTRDATCSAMRSDNTRCKKDANEGMPFCDFHLGKVIDWVASRNPGAMARYVRREEKSYIDHVLRIAREADAIEEDRLLRSEVYFIGIDDQIVKIGRSVNPASRLMQVRQGSSLMPEGYDRKRVELLGTTPGGSRLESKLHYTLRLHRLRGEWFSMHPDVIAVMSYLCLGEMQREASRVLLDSVHRKWWRDEGYLSEAEALEAEEDVA